MASEGARTVTCKASMNIAVIKYWGKRDEELLLPINDSISLTLDENQIFAKTTVSISPDFPRDRMWLNGSEEPIHNPRVQNCLKEVRRRLRIQIFGDGDVCVNNDLLNWKLHIASVNNFPTAAGLASSAAGYACLVYALSKLFELDTEISDIARVGSGSACRSVYGGFVQWLSGTEKDGSDSIAVQLAPASHWPEIKLLVLVVNDKKKTVSSTVGMKNSVNTSDLIATRVKYLNEKRLPGMKKAIDTKDFQSFATLTMKDSNQCHALCLDTWPPIKYMTDISFNIIQLVHKINDYYGEMKVAYTFDAGPNAVLIMLEPMIPIMCALINHYFPSDNKKYFQGIEIDKKFIAPEELCQSLGIVPQQNVLKYILHSKVGNGPVLLNDEREHLLDANGNLK